MAKFSSAVRFQCKYTGSIYEFTQEHDIKGMREHSDYTEVVEEKVVETAPTPKKTAPKAKAD